ncbi:hypothetical protein HII36_32940 [Nonomuraea sp. NN258]|uniref:DUF6891 domain-containing protein n=1 Tax=Nonomuraea antri TaxID=2730852 RepID=UPI0015695254|nr:hypothetical protein [Nonomuraea antri]NRQ36606.1 hypothetical protein [Nonomuraea antri]
MIHESVRARLAEDIRLRVTLGRDDYRRVVADTVETWEGEPGHPEPVTALAEEIASEEFARHLAEQVSWPERTDCDRLSLALIDLAQSGIVTREDYQCCESSAGGEPSSNPAVLVRH